MCRALAMSVDETMEIRGTLCDKFATLYPYILTVGQPLHDWQVLDGDCRIGYAWCTLHGEVFNIGDLKFEQAVIQPQAFLSRLLGRSVKTRNYRRHGLGTRLLPLIIQHARTCGARRITGLVSVDDLAAFPGLTAWYARYGFVFTPGGMLAGQLELIL